jgi:hypothetical protein
MRIIDDYYTGELLILYRTFLASGIVEELTRNYGDSLNEEIAISKRSVEKLRPRLHKQYTYKIEKYSLIRDFKVDSKLYKLGALTMSSVLIPDILQDTNHFSRMSENLFSEMEIKHVNKKMELKISYIDELLDSCPISVSEDYAYWYDSFILGALEVATFIKEETRYQQVLKNHVKEIIDENN